MKKSIVRLALAVLTLGLLGSCNEINERIDSLESRINGVENETIKDISGQVNAISQSIADLGSIRSSIQSLTQTAGSQDGDIESLQRADEALGERIDSLSAYVNGELVNYAKTEWVEATFLTLAEYEKTCDTIAMIDAKIGDLDTRLSGQIATTADSLESWINVQFGSYYTAAQMDAKLEALQAEIDSTDAENKAKADSIASELAEAKAAVDSAKANIRAEYRAAIDTAITSLDGKLSKALQDSIAAVNGRIDHLEGWVKAIDDEVVALRGRVLALEHMIQSVSIIPAYSDGSLWIQNDSLYVDCIISPKEAVSGLDYSQFKVLVKKVVTKAAAPSVILVKEEDFTKDAENGTVSFRVDIKDQIPAKFDKSLAVAVKVDSGVSHYTTDFIGILEPGVCYVEAGRTEDFILPKYERVLLKIDGGNTDFTVKYDGDSHLPQRLEIRVTGSASGNAIRGELPYTHVEFTEGTIDQAIVTTSSNTFKIIHPAKITEKLVVKGGNVVLSGATVKAIEVAPNAVADEKTKAPVEIVLEAVNNAQPKVEDKIIAASNVIVAPKTGVTQTVKAEASGNAQIAVAADAVENIVIDTNDNPIKTKIVAKIGSITYVTLADAIAAVKNGETIDIIADVTDANGISVPKGNKTFTVDFGGHTYTCLDNPAGSTNTTNQVFQLNTGNTITFKNGTIKVAETNKTKFRFIIQNYCDLTLEDMVLDGTNLSTNNDRYTLSNNAGNINLTGKTIIKAAAEKGVAFDIYNYKDGGYLTAPVLTWNSEGTIEGKIEISGATFIVEKDLKITSPIRATKNANGKATLTVKAGATISPINKFSSSVQTAFANSNNSYKSFDEYAGGVVIVNRGANLLINGDGKISTTSNEEWCYSAVCLTEKGELENANTNADRANLTVEGNVTLEGYYYGIVGNGSRHGTDITINGGTIKGIKADDCHGIYHPQNGTLTVNGTNTHISGYNTGIEMRAGTLTVDGGTIEGTATGYEVKPNGSGSTTKGAGIAIAPHTTGKDITVTINSGTIKGNQAISNANPQNQSSAVTVTIKGGTFSDLSGVKYVAENATYTLGADVANAAGMSLDTKKTFTVDFGGHTYTVNKPGAGSTNTQTSAFQLLKGQTITFKNGSIKASDANLNAQAEGDVKPIKRFIQNYANLTLTDMTLDGTNINGDNSVVEFCNGTVVIAGSTNFTAKSGVASINVDSWTAYPDGTNVTINTTGKVGKIHCYSEGTGNMTTKSKLTIINGQDITIDDASNGNVDVVDNRQSK